MSRILRILSGLHEGAQMELAVGDWQIGSDSLCDILLNDVALNQGTIRIHDDGTINFLPASDDSNHVENFLQGERIASEGIEVPLYTCISFGEVHAAFGALEEKNWPHIEITQPNSQENTTEETAETAESSSPAKPRETVALDNVQYQSEDLTLQKEDKKAKSGPRIFSRLLLLVLLLSLTISGIWTLSGPSEAELQKQEIEAVLRSQNISDLIITQEPDASWSVVGGVYDSATQENLEKSLKGLPFKIQTKLVSLRDLAQNIEERIKEQSALLRVQSLQNGLRISGYIFDAKVLDELLAPLKEELTNIYMQKDITYYAQIEKNLQESLNTLGLQSMVTLSPGPYAIVLETSALSKEKRDSLQNFIREATDMTRSINPFVYAKAKPKAAPPQKTMSVVPMVPVKEVDFCSNLTIGGTGSQLYVTYQNEQYARGSHLPNGLQVQEIREKYTTFTQGDRLLYCPR